MFILASVDAFTSSSYAGLVVPMPTLPPVNQEFPAVSILTSSVPASNNESNPLSKSPPVPLGIILATV